MRDGVQHCLNGSYLYIFIYRLSARPNIGIVAGTVEVHDTSRHGLRCSKHRWPKASLVVDTVGEAVTTGLYICDFLMKRRELWSYLCITKFTIYNYSELKFCWLTILFVSNN